ASGTQTIHAAMAPAVQMLDSTCTNPRFFYKPGETACVRIAGSAGTGGTPWHLNLYGGSINECGSYSSLPAYPGVNITTEGQTARLTLPASNAAIPMVCAPGGGSSGTTDV